MTTFADYVQLVRAAQAPRPAPKAHPLIPTWEDLLTFAMVMVVFLSVVNSIEDANWVPSMPSLMLPALVALLTGFLVGRTKLHELFAHLLAIGVGAAVVAAQMVGFARGDTIGARWGDLKERVADFVTVVRDNGISTDNLPFVLLVLALAFVAAYFSAWAVFRWHNAWLGVVPPGIALLTNISYLPGQPATSFIFFLFGAILLVMRMHLLKQIDDWRRAGTPYPRYLSVSYLNAAFWASVVLLVLVWGLPVAKKSNLFAGVWDRVANPIEDRTRDWGRFFAGVASKKPLDLQDFGDIHAFQTGASQSNREIARLTGEPPTRGDLAALRGATYDLYSASGWKIAPQSEVDLAPSEVAPVGIGADATNPLRRQVTVEVQTSDDTQVLLSIGVPVAVNIPAKAEVSVEDQGDIGVLRPADRLQAGDRYVVTGSISVATDKQLAALGTDYPTSITSRYLQLPDELPQRVRDLATELTTGKDTPYEKAHAIELYLRTVPVVDRIALPPPGSDGIDYFLFEARQGFYDYHASAMAVLLRAAGVPARVVSGYVLDQFDRETGEYVIQQANAYTWPEVYFPGVGWVAFSPTADQPAVARSAELDGSVDSAPIGRDPEDLPSGRGGPPRGTFVEARFQQEEPGAAGRSGNWPWFIAAGVFGVLLAAAAGARFLWERGLRRYPYPARVWAKTQRLASWARLGPHPQSTPHEYARELSAKIPGAAPIRTLADAYVRSRFGRKEAAQPAEDARLESAWKSVRLRLVARVLRLR